MRETAALPVFMFHSVAPRGALARHPWLEPLSVPLDLFEATLADWRRRGTRTVGVDDIRGFLAGEVCLPTGSVGLTFDDGYLDNWVAVTPLLKRYGQKAIVFVSTDFIQPGDGVRPGLDDAGAERQWLGYLSEGELRAMSRSGVVEIQSHAATHTWEFISPRVVDFYGPHRHLEQADCFYRFLWLNKNPALKPFALEHLRPDAVPWGTPIYEFAPALVARRYLPDPGLEAELVGCVARSGGVSFFETPDWRGRLETVVNRYRTRNGDLGRLERVEESAARVRGELVGSRARLEAITGKLVRFLSPPQGGATPETLSMAREAGYDLVTAPSAGGVRLNRPGAGSGWVHRCSTGYNLFGRGRGRFLSLISQRLVTARYSGGQGARLVTKTIGAFGRFTALASGRRG